MGVHQSFADQVALYVVGALSVADQSAFEEHVSVCAVCTDELHEYAAVADALALATPQVAPAPAVRRALIARLTPSPPS